MSANHSFVEYWLNDPDLRQRVETLVGLDALPVNFSTELGNLTKTVVEEVSEQKKLKHYVEAAQAIHTEDGHLEVDDNSIVSKGGDGGAYVAAWVWVSDDQLLTLNTTVEGKGDIDG